MNLKLLAFYIFILLLGSFLYLSIIFTYGFSAPFHILVIWLMHERLLSGLKFDLIVDKDLFALIPCIVQNLFVLIYFFSTGDLTFKTLNELYFSWIGLLLIAVTVIEFLVLRRRYYKFMTRRSKA